MSLGVLHRGESWLFPACGYVMEIFHQIALEHGRHARRLPINGTLVTDDPQEKARHYSYEVWRQEALKAVAE